MATETANFPEIAMRPGLRLVQAFAQNETPVSMVQFKGTLYVATSIGIYRLDNDSERLEPVKFKEEENNG